MPFSLMPQTRKVLALHFGSTSLQEAVRASSTHFAAQLCLGKLAECSRPGGLAAPTAPHCG